MGILWSNTADAPPALDGLGFQGVVSADKTETDFKSSKRKLDHLLRASVTNFRPSDINFAIAAAYFLGSSAEQLTAYFEKWANEMCEQRPEDDPTAASVGRFNLDEFIGEKKYEQRYFDYFRDYHSEYSKWSAIFTEHMDIFWPRLALGDFRPLRELATAIETGNELVACRALAETCTEPAPHESDLLKPDFAQKDLSSEFRRIARKALGSRNVWAVINVQAAAEVFLSPTRALKPEQIFAVLDKIDESIRPGEKEEYKEVSVEEALASNDCLLIMFTRARLVLEKISV